MVREILKAQNTSKKHLGQPSLQVKKFCCVLPSSPCQALVLLLDHLTFVQCVNPNITFRASHHGHWHACPDGSRGVVFQKSILHIIISRLFKVIIKKIFSGKLQRLEPGLLGGSSGARVTQLYSCFQKDRVDNLKRADHDQATRLVCQSC